MTIDKKVQIILEGVLGEEVLKMENASRDEVSTWNSLRHLDIVFALEEEFDILIRPEHFSNLNSFKEISDFVRSLNER